MPIFVSFTRYIFRIFISRHDKVTHCCRAFTLALARLSCFPIQTAFVRNCAAWNIHTSTSRSSTYFKTATSKLTPSCFVWSTSRKPGVKRQGRRCRCGSRKHLNNNRTSCAWWRVGWCRQKAPCACVSKLPYWTRNHPGMVGDKFLLYLLSFNCTAVARWIKFCVICIMSRVTLNFDLSKIPCVRF